MPAPLPDDELEAVWRRVRADLEAAVPTTTFRLWLEPLRAVSARGSTLYLTAPDSVRAWVERRYAARLAAALRRHGSQFSTVAFVESGETAKDAGSAAAYRSQPLDPAHTFKGFVIGPGNRLAHAAALAVAELPGEAYNPLFLHGPPGLGKTHLLGAMANYMREQHPDLTVHHTTAERFTSEFVTALRTQGPEAFKRRYRELDALLIDDVQVLEGKARTEEEFVHTFNALYAAGKQIVLSSDRPPSALSHLEERLRDRFQWGLCVQLDPPDIRTRVALLWRMVSRASVPVDDPLVLREIAARTPGNVRLLEGAMTRVVALASVLSEPISRPLIGKALPGTVSTDDASPATSQPATVEAIQEAVAMVLGITREQLLSSSRTPRVAKARQLAMYLTRELTTLSLAQISRAFSRDHSTVLHAIRSVSNRLEPGSPESTTVNEVRAALQSTAATEALATPAVHTNGDDPPPPSTA